MMVGNGKLSECQWGARKRKSSCRRRRPRKKGRGRRATSRNCDGEAVDVRRNTRADSLAQDARRPGTRISKLNRESKQEKKGRKTTCALNQKPARERNRFSDRPARGGRGERDEEGVLENEGERRERGKTSRARRSGLELPWAWGGGWAGREKIQGYLRWAEPDGGRRRT